MNIPFGARVVTLTLVLVLVCFTLPASSVRPFVNASPQTQNVSRPFRMLVLGDSVMWGQGLEEKTKFSYRLREWICAQRQGGQCLDPKDVEIHVEAHSGAVLAEPRSDREKREEALCLKESPPPYCRGEVPNSYPSIWSQVDLARNYYERNNISPGTVDLILVDGGINDMSGAKILMPFFGGDISEHAETYCHEPMKKLLNKIALGRNFPNARIVVTGYFPLVSKDTPRTFLLQTIRAVFPTNIFARGSEQAILDPSAEVSGLRKGTFRKIEDLSTRSALWKEASDRQLQNAVNEFNSAQPSRLLRSATPLTREAAQPALFVSIPFADENAYAAGKDSFLWQLISKTPGFEFSCPRQRAFLARLLGNLIVNDDQQKIRPCSCIEAERARGGTGVFCFRAGAFHPNQKGADAYYEAIKGRLEKIWPSANWAP